MKVAINGFGRIGRLAFRLMHDLEGVEVVGGILCYAKFCSILEIYA